NGGIDYNMFFLSFSVYRCPLQLMPARLVVQYGDPASVNCSTSSTDPAGMGWEARKGGTGFHDEARFVLWKVEELKDWTLEPLCYITLFDNEQCKKRASVTLYKNPDDVSVSLLEQGPMKEGSEYHLQCNITSVAPVQNLTVSWHKGNEVLKTESFNNTERTPEDVASFLSFTPRSHDNGVNLECRAQLSFGLETLPPSVSAEYSAEVYCEFSTNLFIEITSGDDVTLNCSTEGNPSPVLQWTFISADGLTRTTRGNQSSINIIRATSTSAGIYICVATNKVGRVTRFTTLIMKGTVIDCAEHIL
uniref:Ig-like domain-containing protein n=1 Tax=Myripristis murdjan TaxID=586833 RepID=A0A668AQL1_9TELE